MKRFFNDLTINILSLMIIAGLIAGLFFPPGSPTGKILDIASLVVLALALGRTVYCFREARKDREAGTAEPEPSRAVEILNAIDTGLFLGWLVLMLVVPSGSPTWFYILTAALFVIVTVAIVVYIIRTGKQRRKKQNGSEPVL